ncbi:MAG: CBS domain-containing protein [Rhodospirillaceae bacterium]|jgi:CBS domain-containing protein|nr:CBS domain-containing protein [Rhodospirillaceae bacterium]MBT5454966.1 CBS domain-containing protein [Rhodospirillaceae bacterium]
MQIADILGPKGIGVVALLPETTISGAALLLSEQSIGVAVVVDMEHGMVGILSERDITRGLAEFGAEIIDMPVEKMMSRGVVSCDPECTVEDALTLMRDNKIRHLPVIENGTDLVAMVSIRDLTDAQSEMLRQAS